MSVARGRFLASAGAAAAAFAAGKSPALAKGEEYLLREVVSRPLDLETQIKDFRSYLTPNGAFYVSSHFGAPADMPTPDAYRLQVGGEVDKPLSLSLRDLRAMPQRSVVAVLQSAGNGRAFFRPQTPGVQWQFGAVGNARWTGVSVLDVLSRVGVRPLAAHLGLIPADHAPLDTTPRFNRSIPFAKALDPDTILAYEMNGEALPLAQGGPLRLIVPDWVAENSVMWLQSITPQAEETHGYWMDTAYRYPDKLGAPGEPVMQEETHHIQEFPVKSIITQPLQGEVVSADLIPCRGVAFSGYGQIQRVEVSLDGHNWQIADLDDARDLHGWRSWQVEVLMTPGPQRLRARAFDAVGNSQPATQQWNPDGYLWNVYHIVEVQATP
jgi:DMSO/TMAO reductase YedYZ molybdopterin-dependent catalytic subunit